MNRRRFLDLSFATVAMMACGSRTAHSDEPGTRADAVTVPDAKWREVLTPEEYRILRQAGTERAFTGDLWDHKGDGIYTCAACGLPLFDSKTKYDSGTGWPSFFQPVAGDSVAEKVDRKWGWTRTETVCARCGGHLGHVFDDGPQPTGQRYCMNSAALDFVPRKDAPKPKTAPVRLGGVDAPMPKTPPEGS